MSRPRVRTVLLCASAAVWGSAAAAGVVGPSIELSDLIRASMPDEGHRRLTWNFVQYVPIRWKGAYNFPGGAQREGEVMVRVRGAVTERMNGQWQQVPWNITLNSSAVSVGVRLVSINNDGGPNLDCLTYAPQYQMHNCHFRISDALTAPIQSRRLCSQSNGDLRLVRYLIKAPGKATSVAEFSTPADNEAVAYSVGVEFATAKAMSCRHGIR